MPRRSMAPNSDPWPQLPFQRGIKIFMRTNGQEHQPDWLEFVDKNTRKIALFVFPALVIRRYRTNGII